MNKQLCKHCGHQLIRYVEVISGGKIMEKPEMVGEVIREIYDKQQKMDYHFRHASGRDECLYKKCGCKKAEPRGEK